MEAARNRGGLRINSFVRLRKPFANGHLSSRIDEMGDSEGILRNKRYLRETAQALVRRGIVPQEDGWGGWLGRYQRAIVEAGAALKFESRPIEEVRERVRDRGR